MNSGISNLTGSASAFTTDSPPDQKNKNPKCMSCHCSNRDSVKLYFRPEQTEQLFQAPPIYSRIITYLNFEELDALKQAVSQKKNMGNLSSDIDNVRKKRIELLCEPIEVNEYLWKYYYRFVLDGMSELAYDITNGSAQFSYSDPPEIFKVYSCGLTGNGYNGFDLNMHGTLSNGDTFSLHAVRTICIALRAERGVGTMKIFPDWDALFRELDQQDLISFIMDMRCDNLTVWPTEGNQTELRETLIEAFRTITQ